MSETQDRRLTPERYGVPLDNELARRDRLADSYDLDYGQERIFPRLLLELFDEVPEGVDLLEVGAATGLLTRRLLERAGRVTALDPSEGMLQRLIERAEVDPERLVIRRGMVEDLPRRKHYDMAVVTFTPRRGRGLVQLLYEVGLRVREKVVMLLEDDGAMDWAYLARSAAIQGFDVRLSLVTDKSERPQDRRRAVLLVADVRRWRPAEETVPDWGTDVVDMTVPYPAPRGTATDFVRYMIAGGDRAFRIMTEPAGIERLYGNLRTAVHRLGRDELTLRRVGDEIHVVRVPGGVSDANSVE